MLKKLFIGISTAALLLAGSAQINAADDSETVTLKGEGKCAKCALKEADTCQNVLQTKEDGKTVTYYIAKNDISDKFHNNICRGPKKITAKGTVKEVNGKKEFTATELKVAE